MLLLRCMALCGLAGLFLLILPSPALAQGDGAFKVAQANQGMLKIKPDIEGATVILNGQEIGVTPLLKMVPPGTYNIQIKHPHYRLYELSVNLTPGQVVTVDSRLSSNIGDLKVSANVDGATVYIDGERAGETPGVLVKALLVGKHDVRVEKPGYLSYGGQVRIEPRFQVNLDVSLTPNAATLTVVSSVEGATVELDGEPLGEAPLKGVTISGGRHTLAVKASGRGSVYRAFQVGIGEAREFNINPPEKGGGLKVKSKSDGATVYLEGVALGDAPLNIENIAPGRYSVRVSADGFTDRVEKVEVKKGRTAKLKVNLDPEGSFKAERSQSRRQASRGEGNRKVLWVVLGAAVLGGAGAGGWALLPGDPTDPTSGDITVSLP